jgi:hypothetical protein
MRPIRGILFRTQALLRRWRQTYRAARACSRFPNVPDRLMVGVRDQLVGYKLTGDRNALYLETAAWVIRNYLGIFVFEENTDPYFAKDGYVFPLRVLLVGETLFLLRSCDGFGEICERLKEQRDFRSAFYETRATRKFLDAGFKIHVRSEMHKLGEDFDFVASQREVRINVEVTALAEKDFHETTALNALRRKREQLATDRPAVIFCLLPSAWENIGMDINEWMAKLAARFLAGTHRVNVLVFQIERRIDANSDRTIGGMVTISKSFFNHDPRHSADLGFLFEDGMPEEEREAMMNDMGNLALANDLAKRLRTSEFYQWVDYLVP